MNFNTPRLLLFAVIVAAIAVAIGCKSEARPTVAPNPTSTPRPTVAPTAITVVPTATPTPSPTPTPTPSPTPTPTPEAPNAAFFAVFDLAEFLGVGPNTISVTDYDEGSWPDSSYGCPAPGTLYAQGQVQGWSVILEAGSESYEYHVDDSGEALVNCTVNRTLMEQAVNLYELLDLGTTTLIEFRRIDSNGDYTLKSSLTDEAQIASIVEILDVPLLPGPRASCTEIFRVVFVTRTGSHTIGTICGGNSRLVRGDQEFWSGQDANAPAEFSSAIGPFFANEPLPTLPS